MAVLLAAAAPASALAECPSCPADLLLHFSNTAAEASTPDDLLSLLADAALLHLRATSVAVFRVTRDGHLLPETLRHLPEETRHLRLSIDALGGDLEVQLRKILAPTPLRLRTLPFIHGGDLFGALVLLCPEHQDLDQGRAALTQALVNLTAATLHRMEDYAALSRSYAELRASREILARSEKLRALGQLASSVSHDLKNILSPLVMQVQLLQRCAEDVPAGLLDSMERALWRGVETVDRLRSFGRQAPEQPLQAIQINDVIRHAVSLCRPRLQAKTGAPIELVEELGEPPTVLLHGSEFLSAVLNLLVNALDAMEETGGVLRVYTGEQEQHAVVR